MDALSPPTKTTNDVTVSNKLQIWQLVERKVGKRRKVKAALEREGAYLWKHGSGSARYVHMELQTQFSSVFVQPDFTSLT